MKVNPAVEDIELSLIQSDVNDVVRAWCTQSDRNSASMLALLTFPVAGFVAEESYGYFSRSRRAQRLGSLDGNLFEDYGDSLTKVRARLNYSTTRTAGQATWSRS